MKNHFWRTILILMLAALLASCSAFQEAAVGRAPLRIGYSSRWGDYTMVVAQETGFFRSYGASVEPVYFGTAFDAMVDMASGNLDGVLMSLGDTMNVETHIPLRIVAVSDSGVSGALVASHAINNIADLKGRRIGVELGTASELFINRMLQAAGLTASDVTLVNIHPEEMPAAIGFRVDAGYTWEPYVARTIARGNRVLYDPSGVDELFPTVLAFRETTLDSRPDDVRLFLQVWFAAAEFRRSNPDLARQTIAAHLGLQSADVSVDDQVHILNLEENSAYFRRTSSSGGQTLYTAGKESSEFLLRIGVLPRMPQLDFLFDESYLK